MNAKYDLDKVFDAVFEELKTANLIDEAISVESSTLIIGEGSALDSIAFVSLITALEEKVSDFSGININIIIDRIPSIDVDNPQVTVEDVKLYILTLLHEKS